MLEAGTWLEYSGVVVVGSWVGAVLVEESWVGAAVVVVEEAWAGWGRLLESVAG